MMRVILTFYIRKVKLRTQLSRTHRIPNGLQPGHGGMSYQWEFTAGMCFQSIVTHFSPARTSSCF